MKPDQMVRITNDTGNPWDTRVIEPKSGNSIPFVRRVEWEVGVDGCAVATIELHATLDVMAQGTIVVTPVSDESGGKQP